MSLNYYDTKLSHNVKIKLAIDPKKSTWYHHKRRAGRVVECGGLENRCTARYQGFESLALRHKT